MIFCFPQLQLCNNNWVEVFMLHTLLFDLFLGGRGTAVTRQIEKQKRTKTLPTVILAPEVEWKLLQRRKRGADAQMFNTGLLKQMLVYICDANSGPSAAGLGLKQHVEKVDRDQRVSRHPCSDWLNCTDLCHQLHQSVPLRCLFQASEFEIPAQIRDACSVLTHLNSTRNYKSTTVVSPPLVGGGSTQSQEIAGEGLDIWMSWCRLMQ